MKELHESIVDVIRKTPMSVSDLSEFFGVSKRYIGLIIQAHRSTPHKTSYYIADYERTTGTMIPLYRYGRGVDIPKPPAKCEKERKREWYHENKAALRAKRMAKEGKQSSPWDALLRK